MIDVGQSESAGELTMIDWEWTGVYANPMFDITMFLLESVPKEFSAKYEKYLITRYWLVLVAEGGIDKETYTLEQIWDDYRYKGGAYFAGALMSFFSLREMRPSD